MLRRRDFAASVALKVCASAMQPRGPIFHVIDLMIHLSIVSDPSDGLDCQWRLAMPKTVQIDDDAYEFARRDADFGEDFSAYLRRKLGIAPRQNGAPRGGAAADPSTARLAEAQGALRRCIAEQALHRRNPTDHYLSLLSAAYKDKGADFEKVLALTGRRRKYFGRSSEEIEKSGTSTHPRQIPDSPYWALTNADTDQKREMLTGALRVLGYSSDDIEAAVQSVA